MKTQSKIAKIDSRLVKGEGHLQPNPNPWIGVFVVPGDLLESTPADWKSVIIDYEGPFNCKNKGYTNGKGKAIITHIRKEHTSGKIIINAEGIDKPILEKNIQDHRQFGYNVNLPGR